MKIPAKLISLFLCINLGSPASALWGWDSEALQKLACILTITYTSYGIVSNLVSDIAPPVYRYATTGNWYSPDYQEHQQEARKQIAENNRFKLSTGAMNVCWQEIKKLENAIKSIPDNETEIKRHMLQSLYETKKNCGDVIVHHTAILPYTPSEVDEHYKQMRPNQNN